MAKRRTSARLKNKWEGIPLPAEHNDIYGENDEIVPVPGRDLRRRGEEDDDELVLAQHSMLRGGAGVVTLRNTLNGNASSGGGASGNAAGGATGSGSGAGLGAGAGAGSGPRAGVGAGAGAGAGAGTGTNNASGNGRSGANLLDSPRQFSPEQVPQSYSDPNHPPFPEDGGNGGSPGVSRADLPNPYRTPYNSGRHPSESSTLAAKYGMAGGRIPSVPLSTRSFIHEHDLYENADVHTPMPQPMSRRPVGPVEMPRLIPFPPMRRDGAPKDKIPTPTQSQGPQAPSQPGPQAPSQPGLQVPQQGQGQRPMPPVDLPPSRPAAGPDGRGRGPKPPPAGPTVDSGRKPWMQARFLEGLRKRLAFNRGENINAPEEPRPSTTKDDLSAGQIMMAERFRQQMRRPDVGDGKVQEGAPWQKPKTPADRPAGTSGRERPGPSPNPRGPDDQPKPPKGPRPIYEEPKLPNGAGQGPAVAGGDSPPRPPPLRRPAGLSADNSWSRTVQRWLDAVWAAVCGALTSLWNYRALLLLLIPLLYLANTDSDRDRWLPRVPTINMSGLGKYIPSPVPFQLRHGSQLEKIRDRLERLEEDVRGLLIREGARSVGGDGPVSVIAVDKDKNGRLIVPPAFYEALKDRIAQDQKLIKDVIDQGLPAMDDHLLKSDTLSKAWDSWVTHNKKRVIQTLGPQMEKEVAKMTQKEVNSYVKKNGDKFGADKSLVSQDDFGKLVQKEIKAGLAKELKDTANQVSDLDKKLQQYIDNPPQGMSRAQVTALVEKVVKKYKSNLNSGAAAEAGLKGHFASYQANNVNFFSIGSGAVVDPTMSSPKWKIPKYEFKSKKWFDRDGYKPQPLVAAITPWAEEGECFCAGPNIRGEGVGTANVSVLISRDVVPRYLVVEHILPGATLDAAATPKDIEVWGSFMDINLRKTVLGWSESRFPEAVHERALHTGFVKLGEFVYESASSGDGVQVFTLSNDLLDMNAAANHFVIRAVNNQGGADHTCFYRLRLYGDIRERDLGF